MNQPLRAQFNELTSITLPPCQWTRNRRVATAGNPICLGDEAGSTVLILMSLLLEYYREATAISVKFSLETTFNRIVRTRDSHRGQGNYLNLWPMRARFRNI